MIKVSEIKFCNGNGKILLSEHFKKYVNSSYLPQNGEVLVTEITKIVQKYIPEVCKTVTGEVSQKQTPQNVVQISKVASECVSNLQKGLIGTKKSFSPLKRDSLYCAYFGGDSAKNVQKQLESQMSLSWLKAREQNLVTFPPITLSGEPETKSIKKALNKLKEQGFGRMTVTDKLFGHYVEEGTHTIGLVHNGGKFGGKYIILDSIPETYPQIKDYHARLIKHLGLNPEDVMFSNKPQQTLEEYTCNNWTHANLDAVIEYLKNGKDKELTPEVLDKILPKDINAVLKQQFLYISDKLKGRALSDVVIEAYGKKHRA